MKKFLLTSFILVTCLVGIIFSTMTNPQLSYTPTEDELPQRIDPNDSPAQIVREFLEENYLPPSGTQLNQLIETLEWESDTSTQMEEEAEHAITDVVIEEVVFSSVFDFWSNILDDDPIYSATVKANVETANGKSSLLAIGLWDYGLITPWALYPKGDGWKPSKVVYVE